VYQVGREAEARQILELVARHRPSRVLIRERWGVSAADKNKALGGKCL